jgi:hypothetical protein
VIAKILEGDIVQILKGGSIKRGSIDCVVTSPP